MIIEEQKHEVGWLLRLLKPKIRYVVYGFIVRHLKGFSINNVDFTKGK